MFGEPTFSQAHLSRDPRSSIFCQCVSAAVCCRSPSLRKVDQYQSWSSQHFCLLYFCWFCSQLVSVLFFFA